MKKCSILCIVLTAFSVASMAQAIIWDSAGDRKLTFLKGENLLNLQFDYEGVTVNGKTENEFLEKRKDEFNDKKDGRGDNFVDHWQEVKTKRYPAHFEKSFKKIAKKKMKLSQGASEKYTLIVQLVKAKTGEGTYVKNVPATAEFEIRFVETATQKIVAKGKIMNAKGIVKAKSNLGRQGQVLRVIARSMNTDVANRIAQCYDAAGTATAKYVMRFNKKKK
ncbi:MAG: hypothetical protein IPJ31_09480 [Bacteroidetes bacterium]|nr:hypothetical protein [Bacteroidota bacterium]MBP6314593.1 hypothetical protein [Chitinophagaceae bacterium]